MILISSKASVKSGRHCNSFKLPFVLDKYKSTHNGIRENSIRDYMRITGAGMFEGTVSKIPLSAKHDYISF